MNPKNGKSVQYIGSNNGQPTDPQMAKVFYNRQPLSSTPGVCDLIVESYNGFQAIYAVPYAANTTTANSWTFITGPLGSHVATEETALAAAAADVITKLALLSWSAEQTAVATTGNELRLALGQTARSS
jgi:hypothetical protein